MHTLTKSALIRLLNDESIEVEQDGDCNDDALALACQTIMKNIQDPQIQGLRVRWIVMARFRDSPVEYQVKLMKRVYQLVPGYRALVDDLDATVSKKVIRSVTQNVPTYQKVS